jgi:hypothetical protein
VPAKFKTKSTRHVVPQDENGRPDIWAGLNLKMRSNPKIETAFPIAFTCAHEGTEVSLS